MSNEPSETQKAISEWAPQPAVGKPKTNELPVISVEPASAADPTPEATFEGNVGSASAPEAASAAEPQPGPQLGPQPGPQSAHPGAQSPGYRPDMMARRPKTGTIVWGVLMLAFCAYMAVQLFAPDSVDLTTFVIAGTIGLGVILLAVGAIVVVRSNRNSRK